MLDTLLLVVAIGVFAVAFTGFVDLAIGNFRIPSLSAQPVASEPQPRVSVIIAARDEEEKLESALQSVLAQEYTNYEVIVVNDRSADRTGEILDRLAGTSRRLKVVHIGELPDGWLGKNHALQSGADMADGDLLLFSDADVVFAPTAISRAVHFLSSKPADHVTVGPDLDNPTAPLALLVHFFMVAFLLYTRPWKASDPGSRHHIGIGAFNLVRVSTYRAAGMHRRIAMRPDDDLKLGKIIKLAGGRQHVLHGMGMISVRWYSSLREMIAGFQKNSFAGLNYSVLVLAGAVIGSIALNIWPFIAVFLTDGLARWLYGGTALLMMTIYAGGAAIQRDRPWLALFYPAAAAIFIYILVSASFRTLRNGGIAWRGTKYSLAELKANRV